MFGNPTDRTDHRGITAAGEPHSSCTWHQPTAWSPRRWSQGSAHVLRGSLGPPTRVCQAGLRVWFLWTRCGHGGRGRDCGVTLRHPWERAAPLGAEAGPAGNTGSVGTTGSSRRNRPDTQVFMSGECEATSAHGPARSPRPAPPPLQASSLKQSEQAGGLDLLPSSKKEHSSVEQKPEPLDGLQGAGGSGPRGSQLQPEKD